MKDSPKPKPTISASVVRLEELRPIVVVPPGEREPLTFPRLASVSGPVAFGGYTFRGGEEILAIKVIPLSQFAHAISGGARANLLTELGRLTGITVHHLVVVGERSISGWPGSASSFEGDSMLALASYIAAEMDIPVTIAPTAAAAAHKVEEIVWDVVKFVVARHNEAAARTSPPA